MMSSFSVTFLGTSSGGGPSESRNCSSLICDVVGDGSLWMVDCAEGTTRQFTFQIRSHTNLKLNKVSKIFVTHMHADHIMGIVPFLRNILFPPPTGTSDTLALHDAKPPKIEIYGPSGIRIFVRQIMKMTLTRTADFFVVHELITPGDQITPCTPHDNTINSIQRLDMMHCNEVAGQDILCSEDGFWREFTGSRGLFGDIFVDAGPILHRDPCLGYVIREASGPNRKLVILGDTHDPSSITPLCVSPSPSLLIHEATDAHIPKHVDYNARRSPEAVLEKALSRGHSIPAMAGTFARIIGAERLVLNHIGGRFPAPKYAQDHRSAVMREIERQATEAWASRIPAVAAHDFMQVHIPAMMPVSASIASSSSSSMSISSEMMTLHTSESVTMQLHHADPTEGFLYANKSRDHSNRSRKRRR
ncbi:hypothetical protein D9615_001789 [Tricholomella constricta]|uniref:Metallo-beta-lactamase domain-containing protein n=1 Tax=Tricholomella constricta TaxID=117010 RepID=A0A8H5HNU7_9AGAR|nr:hypothetical protein D9615_001789 [Tricholomella constricta]